MANATSSRPESPNQPFHKSILGWNDKNSYGNSSAVNGDHLAHIFDGESTAGRPLELKVDSAPPPQAPNDSRVPDAQFQQHRYQNPASRINAIASLINSDPDPRGVNTAGDADAASRSNRAETATDPVAISTRARSPVVKIEDPELQVSSSGGINERAINGSTLTGNGPSTSGTISSLNSIGETILRATEAHAAAPSTNAGSRLPALAPRFEVPQVRFHNFASQASPMPLGTPATGPTTVNPAAEPTPQPSKEEKQLQPASPPRKRFRGGKPKGAQKFTALDESRLLQVVGRTLPTTPQMWEQVTEEYNRQSRQVPRKERYAKYLREKFRRMVREGDKILTGHHPWPSNRPNLPEAYRIEDELKQKRKDQTVIAETRRDSTDNPVDDGSRYWSGEDFHSEGGQADGGEELGDSDVDDELVAKAEEAPPHKKRLSGAVTNAQAEIRFQAREPPTRAFPPTIARPTEHIPAVTRPTDPSLSLARPADPRPADPGPALARPADPNPALIRHTEPSPALTRPTNPSPALTSASGEGDVQPAIPPYILDRTRIVHILEAQLERAEGRNSRLENKNNALSEENRNLHEKNDALKKENHRLEMKVQMLEMQQQVQQMKEAEMHQELMRIRDGGIQRGERPY